MRLATTGQGELDVASMKKYIQYCKAKCSPRLSEEAGEVLTSSYVKIRDDVRKKAISASGQAGGDDDTQAVIPITVRQLEALVQISESLAKMHSNSVVRAEDVTEAFRLSKLAQWLRAPPIKAKMPTLQRLIVKKWNEQSPSCAAD